MKWETSAVDVPLHLYTIFDQRRVDIIDQVEYGVHDRLDIYPPVCDLLLPLA